MKAARHERRGRNGRIVGALCGAALAIVPLAALGQQETTIKIEVRQVLVPVVVTDRAGRHVTGLKAEDFKVFEDGVEQPIVSFGTELAPGAPSAPAAPTPLAPQASTPAALPAVASPAPIRRTYLVLIDTLLMSFSSAERLRKALPKLFGQEKDGEAQYALAALGSNLRILRSVTRKPEEVLAAAESHSLMRAIRESSAGNLAGQDEQLRTMLETYCRQCECITTGAPLGGPFILQSSFFCEGLMQKMENFVANTARERSALFRSFLSRLAEIIQLAGRQPGKRIMILASDGLDLKPGEDLYHLVANYTNRPSFPLRNPVERLEHELDEVARVATASDVVIYTVDARGVPPPTAGAFSSEIQGGRFVRRDMGRAMSEMVTQVSLTENAKQDTLARLAGVTGGLFFRGNSDLSKGMRQAFEDERAYYVLAYSAPPPSDDGRFRKIRVELRDKKLKIRAKQGYWAPRPEAKDTASVTPSPPSAHVIP